VESSIPPPPSYSMMPSPSSIPPPPPMYEGSGTRSPARVRDERSSYTPGPLKDRAKTPSPRTKLTPPSKLRARSRTPVSTAKGKGKDPARAATALGDKRASPWPKEEFTPLKEKELTLPPPTMSPPPLPGLTPPPALDAGGRSRHSFQMDSLVVSSPKPLDSPAAGDPMSEQQSATPSDIASVDGRTALSEAEAALERAILGKEPVTAGHFHGLLAALVHVAQQGRASFDDARSVLEQMRTLRVPVDVPALRSALDVLAIDVARGKAEVCDGEALVQDLLKAGNVVRLGLPVFRAMLRVLAAGAGRGCAAPRDSERVVALMQEHECECDVATYNLMLDVVARSARCGRAEVADGVNVLYKIKKAGLTPDVNTFRSLMDVVAWSARRGRASMQDAEMVQKHARTHTRTHLSTLALAQFAPPSPPSTTGPHPRSFKFGAL